MKYPQQNTKRLLRDAQGASSLAQRFFAEVQPDLEARIAPTTVHNDASRTTPQKMSPSKALPSATAAASQSPTSSFVGVRIVDPKETYDDFAAAYERAHPSRAAPLDVSPAAQENRPGEDVGYLTSTDRIAEVKKANESLTAARRKWSAARTSRGNAAAPLKPIVSLPSNVAQDKVPSGEGPSGVAATIPDDGKLKTQSPTDVLPQVTSRIRTWTTHQRERLLALMQGLHGWAKFNSRFSQTLRGQIAEADRLLAASRDDGTDVLPPRALRVQREVWRDQLRQFLTSTSAFAPFSLRARKAWKQGRAPSQPLPVDTSAAPANVQSEAEAGSRPSVVSPARSVPVPNALSPSSSTPAPKMLHRGEGLKRLARNIEERRKRESTEQVPVSTGTKVARAPRASSSSAIAQRTVEPRASTNATDAGDAQAPHSSRPVTRLTSSRRTASATVTKKQQSASPALATTPKPGTPRKSQSGRVSSNTPRRLDAHSSPPAAPTPVTASNSRPPAQQHAPQQPVSLFTTAKARSVAETIERYVSERMKDAPRSNNNGNSPPSVSRQRSSELTALLQHLFPSHEPLEEPPSPDGNDESDAPPKESNIPKMIAATSSYFGVINGGSGTVGAFSYDDLRYHATLQCIDSLF